MPSASSSARSSGDPSAPVAAAATERASNRSRPTVPATVASSIAGHLGEFGLRAPLERAPPVVRGGHRHRPADDPLAAVVTPRAAIPPRRRPRPREPYGVRLEAEHLEGRHGERAGLARCPEQTRASPCPYLRR